MRAALHLMADAMVASLFPALCVVCGGVLGGFDRGLCGSCRSRLVPTGGSSCPRCGVPADDDEQPCLTCVGSPPPQLGTMLWGAYDGVLRRAMLALKHGGHDELARPLGRRLAARIATTGWHDRVSAVAAVPSHGLRRLRRRGCAAHELAREVAMSLERPLLPALRRHGLGRQQGRTRAQRLRLPRGSFSAARSVSGHRLLLVDDVSTTGTTLRRAAEALLGAGAEAVWCAAMAHAPDPRRL